MIKKIIENKVHTGLRELTIIAGTCAPGIPDELKKAQAGAGSSYIPEKQKSGPKIECDTDLITMRSANL